MPEVNVTEATTTEKDEAITRVEEAPAVYSPVQKAVAEFVGTFALIFIGAGSIVAAVAAGGGEGGAGLVTTRWPTPSAPCAGKWSTNAWT